MLRMRERALRRRCVGIALASTLVLAGARAHAQQDDVDQPSLRAEKLAAEAESRSASGAHAAAVELYLQANQVAPAAVFAFDIAWLEEHHLGAPELALYYYRQCVAALDVEPALAARASERIAALESAARPALTTPAPVATVPPGARVAERPSWSPMKTVAVAVAGAGVVTLGVGAAFALVARSKDKDAQQYCDGDRCKDPRALTLTGDAVSAAHAADFAIVTGAVLVAAGVALWLLAPRGSASVSARPRSLVLGGTW